MKKKSELAKEINKDVISLLLKIIDDHSDICYLTTTDNYYIENQCDFKAIAAGYEIRLLNQVFVVTQLNISFEMNGLSEVRPSIDMSKGIFNPYSAILSVYVTKKTD